MSNIYFMCENCGIETNGITFVNGMKFCAKCYHQIFGKDNQQIEITQLKQQLVEKDKEIKRVTKIDNKTFLFETYEKPLREQIQLLKQQLIEKQNKIDEISKEFVQAVHAVYDWRVLCAEKDKEIEKLKQQYTILENENGKLTTELIMDKYKKAQKEVSFGKQLAIQELEKVKIMAEDLLEKFCSSWEYHQKYMRGHRHIEYYDLIQGIDNRIKELKGEHDE